MLQSLEHSPAKALLPTELGQGDGLALLRQVVEKVLLLSRGGTLPCWGRLNEDNQPAGPALKAWGLLALA
jgi:hypothetical protein